MTNALHPEAALMVARIHHQDLVRKNQRRPASRWSRRSR